MSKPTDEPTVTPLVSICLPTCNSIQFLRERLDSIQAQVLKDWELLVADSFSEDGTWVELEKLANRDSRVRLFQIPREGIYPAFNFLIKKAQCRYIYVATSDDTMRPDCLSKMVAAMERFSECDICHTPLEFIDERGKSFAPQRWFNLPVASYLGHFAQMPHLRLAPLDGIMHLAVNTVYTSITQILIRRTLFEKTGLFRTDWGSRGDFEWGVRAGFLANVVYLPEKLATWRLHDAQATQNAYTPEHMESCVQMVEAAVSRLGSNHQLTLPTLKEATEFYRMNHLAILLNGAHGLPCKLRRICERFWIDPRSIINYIAHRLFFFNSMRFKESAWVARKLQDIGVSGPVPLPGMAPANERGDQF